MLRHSGGHGKAESRKDTVVGGWCRSWREARTETGWGIAYDGDQGTGQAMMNGLAEDWTNGRARVRTGG